MPAWLSSLFSRRSLNDPRTPLSAPDDWLFDALGARRSVTGVSVTPENALEVTAVWAAVRMIAGTLATLPLHTYRSTEEGKERAKEHPAYRLLHTRPNPEQSAFSFRETLGAHLLIFGNAYAEIERNGMGEPVALWPLLPYRVRSTRDDAGRKLYLVSVEGQEVPLAPENVVHVAGFSLDGQAGLVPIHLMREAVALGKATEQFGASFFGNGAAPSGVLSHPGKLGAEAAQNLRTSWTALTSGLSNAHRVAILEEGMSWAPLGIPPEHAQFLESRKFQVSEVARIFGIPPHLVGDLERSTFSNIEAQGIEFVKFCIEPWTRRIEQELNYKLFPDEDFFAEHSLEGLLRGDSAARAAWYTAMSQLGVYSVNEIRALENLNAVPGGDVRLAPLHMAPTPTTETPDE